MTNQNLPRSLFSWIFIFNLFVFSDQVFSQCAGADSTVTVCNKDQDATTGNYTLFDKLSGTPTAGGTWATTDPANFVALDRTNGIVDLWRINNNGIHQFIYTNNACGQSATITINLGGYPGEDNTDGSANACSDNPLVNLHGFLGSEIDGKVQDFNGIWEEDPSTATGFLSGNFFNAFQAGPGVYLFSYTVSGVPGCPDRQANVVLEVHLSPDPGIPSNLIVCTNEDLSTYTNLDLTNYLSREDPNGTWSESGTNQLSDLTDHEIDVQAINTNFGYGTYNFRYTVYPTHPVCTEEFADVKIIILPALDGTLTPPNFCVGTPYDVPVTYDSSILPNGEYRITYQINDNGGTRTDFDDAVLNGGQGTLRLDSSLIALNELVALDVIGIVGINPVQDVCPDIIVPQATFLVSEANASTTDICPNTDVTVDLTNLLDVSGNFSNEIYDINYAITDPDSNTSNFTVQNIPFTNGGASFDIPHVNLGLPGPYSIAIDIPASFNIDCSIATNFTMIQSPELIVLDLIVDNSCNATKIDVVIDAPLLADGTYDVIYNVILQSTGQVVIENTINFAGGTASYDLDVASLEQGNYTVSVRSTQNDTTPCRTEFDFEANENFAIEGIPALPVAAAQQAFCLNTFLPNTPTLEDIEVSANGQTMFYATATDMAILPLDTPLVDGEDYFISNIDPDNNCEGSDRIQVVVALLNPEAPTLISMNPTFCGFENATVSNLNISVANSGNLVWFETASGETVIDGSTLLIDGKSYFAATETNGQCLSSMRVEVLPTVYGLEPVSLQFSDLALCGIDNPTLADLRDAESENPFEVLWYDTPENGRPLDDSVLLINDTVYYAESFNSDTGCMNPERMAVTVDLTDCDPEDYGFFIPDGFSPNGDGRNDAFFVPNIEIIFPDFTLEILNRYGATLFKGGQNNPAWDGSNKGGIAPNGVYFYVIDYNKEGHKPIQGRLYLNR